MTDNEFGQGLTGSIARTKDQKTRLCHIVAEGLSQRAKERQAEGRPDIAGRLRWVASQLDGHRRPTKAPLAKLKKDIEIVRERFVDGIPIADWDSER
jgi:hypothetical protein